MKRIASAIVLLLSSAALLASCGSEGTPSSSFSRAGLADALAYAKAHSVGVSGKVYTVFESAGSAAEDDVLASYDLHNVFSTGILSSEITYHYDLGDGDPIDEKMSATYFAKEDGYTYRRGLTLQNQVVDDQVKSSSTGAPLVFEDHFASPFLSLQYSDFVSLNGQFLLKPTAAKSFAVSLTQQSVSAKKVVFDLSNGVLSNVTIYTSSASTSIGGVYSSQRMDLAFHWGEVGQIPDIQPYAHQSVHDQLQVALYNVNRKLKSKNFTVTISETTGEGLAEGHYYATSDCVYSDAADGYNTYGATKVGSGFYEFSVSTSSSGEQKVTIYDENPISESELYPSFDGFAPELFVSEDGKTFTCREGIEGNVIPLFTPYTQSSYYEAYVSELRIRLDASGAFQDVQIDYYDYQNLVQGTATLTYGSFGETVVPVEF